MVESNRWRGVVMIVGAATCWGAMAAVIKLLFRDRGVDPLLLVVIRAYLATLILFAGLAIDRAGPAADHAREGFAPPHMVGIGGLLTNNYLYFEAIHLTSVAMALLLQYQAPVLVAIYGALVSRKRISLRLALSLLLTVLGCALVVRIYDPAAIRLNLVGVLAGLGTAFALPSTFWPVVRPSDHGSVDAGRRTGTWRPAWSGCRSSHHGGSWRWVSLWRPGAVSWRSRPSGRSSPSVSSSAD